MLIKNLCLRNVLGFGDTGVDVELRALNVIIGPNGSGKSNFIEAIDLIRSTPITSESSNLLAAIRDGGGVRDWLWKGTEPAPRAAIDAVFENPKGSLPLRYVLGFSEVGQRFEIQDERIESENPFAGYAKPYIYYAFEHGHGVLNVSDPAKRRSLQREEIDPTESILSQRKDPDSYPELTYPGRRFSEIRLYRNWSFGRDTPPRRPQKTDLPNNYLSPDANNLALVLNNLSGKLAVKKRMLAALQELYAGIGRHAALSVSAIDPLSSRSGPADLHRRTGVGAAPGCAPPLGETAHSGVRTHPTDRNHAFRHSRGCTDRYARDRTGGGTIGAGHHAGTPRCRRTGAVAGRLSSGPTLDKRQNRRNQVVTLYVEGGSIGQPDVPRATPT